MNDLAEWLDRSYPGQATVLDSGMGGKASNTALAHLDEKVLVHRPDTVFFEFSIKDAAPFPPGNLDYGLSPEKAARSLLLIDHHAAWRRLQSSDRPLYERYIPDGVHPAAEGSRTVTFSAIQTALKLPST